MNGHHGTLGKRGFPTILRVFPFGRQKEMRNFARNKEKTYYENEIRTYRNAHGNDTEQLRM